MRGATISTDEGGLSLAISDGRGWYVAWSAIERIETFKRDLITTDDVCLSFLTATGAHVVDEEMDGWDALCRAMSARFAIAADWFDVVVQPAFATNHRVLWDGGADVPPLP